METFKIEQFVGQVNNPPDGTHMAPTELLRLGLDNQGGYRYTKSRRRSAMTPTGFTLDITAYPNIVMDDSGLLVVGDDDRAYLLNAPTEAWHRITPPRGYAPYIVEGVGAVFPRTDREIHGAVRPGGGFDEYIVSFPYRYDNATSGASVLSRNAIRVNANSQSGGSLGPTGDWLWIAIIYVHTAGGLLAYSTSQHPFASQYPIDEETLTFTLEGTATPPLDFIAHIYMRHSSMTDGDYVLAGSVDFSNSLTVTEAPIGPILASGDGVPALHAPEGARVVAHQGRYYWPINRMVQLDDPTWATNMAPAMEEVNNRAKNSLLIGFSEPGTVNYTTVNSWFPVNFQAGGLTGMASSPGGLLIFSKGETQILMGDPIHTQDVELKRLSATIGHDFADRPPSRLGGAVFTISNGRIYQIVMGMGDIDFGKGVEDISAPIFDPDRPFQQVMADAANNAVIGLRDSERRSNEEGAFEVMRYDLNSKEWHVWVTPPISMSLPNDLLYGLLVTGNGPGGWRGSGVLTQKEAHRVYFPATWEEGGADAEASARWEGLDLGLPDLVKSWRAVEMFLDNPPADLDEMPFLIIRTAGRTYRYNPLIKDEGHRLLYKLDRNLVAARIDMKFEFDGHTFMPEDAAWPIIRPPIIIYYSPRRRER